MRASMLSCVAGFAAVAMSLSGGCSGGGGGGGRAQVNQGPIQCGETILASLINPAGSPIQLTNPRAVRHFQITNLSPATGEIQIELDSTAGNGDLYLAVPGTSLGDSNTANYYFSSTDTGPTDQIVIGPQGVRDLAGNLDVTYTISDFLAPASDPVFVVAAAAAPADFTVQIVCFPPPASTSPISCWGQSTGSVPGSTSPNLPDFTDPAETVFFELPALAATTEEVIIDLSIASGEAHLALSAPGTTPGSLVPGDYIFCSCEVGDDEILMDLGGIIGGGGATAPGLTLSDFLASPYPISFLVMGYASSTNFDVGVTCYDPASPPPPATTTAISCANQATGTVPGSLSPTLPIFTDLGETIFYEIPPFAATVNEVVLDLTVASGDAHLFLAVPGAAPGSLDRGDYIFWSTEVGNDRITIDLTGITDIAGGSTTSVTLADYIGAAVPIGFLVAGFDPSTDYTVAVNCCDPNGPFIRDISCATPLAGVSIEGPLLGQPDLTVCRQNHFYRITSIPGGAEHVTILASTTLTGGDVDVYLLDVGLPPGSTNIADYIYNSRPGAPFTVSQEDHISVTRGGVASFFKSQNTPTLTDYETSGVEMSFVVTGRSPLSAYDLTIFCDSAPIQTPVTIACGGSDSGSLVGKFLTPPDYTDPNEVTFYEIDASTLPVGVTSIDIALTTLSGDCDLYLAAPGTTPGIPAMIYESVQSMTTTDGVIIDATGLTGKPGPQGRSTSDWTLNDYLAAPTNISFVVQSWELASDYSLTVTCN